MSPLAITLLTNLAVIVAAMFAMWLVSVRLGDVSLIDPCWGAGFVIVAWCSVLLNPPAGTRAWLLTALTTVWGLRLALFLTWRFLKHRRAGDGEDRRYAAMRAKRGDAFWWQSLFSVFWLQAMLLWFIAMPQQVAAVEAASATAAAGAAPSVSLGWLDFCGLALWGVGIFFESIGDWQLARFKSRPRSKGSVLQTGLWRYTRHPNYFGDFCVWWGLYLIAASGGAGWTIASPLIMSVLLLKVSGVTLLEKDITERRPEYAAYQARTNAFFPGPPKKA